MKNMREWMRMVKFTLFSVSAGIVQMSAFALLNELTAWPYWPCYVTALVLSVVWNFTLNRKFTFKSAGNVPLAMFKALLFYVPFTPASAALGAYLSETLLWNEYVVTVLNMVLNFALEYLYQRFFVFAKQIDTAVKHS